MLLEVSKTNDCAKADVDKVAGCAGRLVCSRLSARSRQTYGHWKTRSSASARQPLRSWRMCWHVQGRGIRSQCLVSTLSPLFTGIVGPKRHVMKLL